MLPWLRNCFLLHIGILLIYVVLWEMPYGMKILHGIKFYGFMVGDTTVELKPITFILLIVRCLC